MTIHGETGDASASASYHAAAVFPYRTMGVPARAK
jgi:hypothetical protein